MLIHHPWVWAKYPWESVAIRNFSQHFWHWNDVENMDHLKPDMKWHFSFLVIPQFAAFRTYTQQFRSLFAAIFWYGCNHFLSVFDHSPIIPSNLFKPTPHPQLQWPSSSKHARPAQRQWSFQSDSGHGPGVSWRAGSIDMVDILIHRCGAIDEYRCEYKHQHCFGLRYINWE